jgi:hypothetical protein
MRNEGLLKRSLPSRVYAYIEITPYDAIKSEVE